eukprot:3183056-Rhodomonas_salina.2
MATLKPEPGTRSIKQNGHSVTIVFSFPQRGKAWMYPGYLPKGSPMGEVRVSTCRNSNLILGKSSRTTCCDRQAMLRSSFELLG